MSLVMNWPVYPCNTRTRRKISVQQKDLQAAEERIVAREKLLESRVRLMYTDGAVSYLDVLLSSTSFTDFLTRADSLKTIVDQDQHLLDEHKADKQLVVDKKAELDVQYAEAKSLYAQKKQRKSQLNEKKRKSKCFSLHMMLKLKSQKS